MADIVHIIDPKWHLITGCSRLASYLYLGLIRLSTKRVFAIITGKSILTVNNKHFNCYNRTRLQ